MEIDLKNRLRALRKEKNITQEDLANHLSITPQSVGKWERGEGYPDITLLPKIALYFGITVDELLNVDKARIEEKINAYKDESRQLNNKGGCRNFRRLRSWKLKPQLKMIPKSMDTTYGMGPPYPHTLRTSITLILV